MRSARSMTWGWRATLAILGLFIAVTWLLHFRLTDPRFLYCEDIAHYFLPTKAYTYQHPLEAFAGRPTPSTHFGSATFTLGGPAVVFPLLPALAARIAPQEPSSLMGFEWGITSLYVIASMTALFFFLSRAKVPTALAAAVACTYPWLYTIFIEWRHVDLLRGRLMLPLVLLGLFLATTKGGYAYWALLAAATVICMGQAFALYWVGALVCLWLAIHAWLERRTLLERLHGEGLLAIRRAGPPLLSLSLVSLALLPMYLRSRGAIEESAFLGQMASDPERLLDYLYRGHDWFTFADLLKPGRGLAPWSIAGISLLVAVMINGRRGRRQVIEGEVWAAPDELRPLRRIGGPLFLVSLALSFLPEVPFDLFAIRGDRLEWSFLPLAVTPSAAIFFHTTQRTWLVLAEIGGLLLGVGYLAEWTLRPSTPGRRRVEVAVAVGVYALLLFLAHALSRATLTIDVAVAVLVIAAVLAVATLAGQPGARPYLGSAALIVAGLLFSWRFADQSYQTGALHCSQGVKDARITLARDESILKRVPEEVRHQREYRLLGEKWCYYLDTPCALSYSLHWMPREVFDFFEATDLVREVNLPYWMILDYPRMLELGIAQMMGIRWWILPGRLMPGGIPLTDENDPENLHFFEAADAFPKGWALSSWEIVQSFEEAAQRLVNLAGSAELRRHGILTSTQGGALPEPPDSQRGDLRASIDLVDAKPGELLFQAETSAPTVLATNEFFHQNWRAVVDGNPVPVLRVNASFVAVALGPGRHEVRLTR